MLMQTELVWLLGAVARGDETAFERLYTATRAKIYGVLLRILGRPASRLALDSIASQPLLRSRCSAGRQARVGSPRLVRLGRCRRVLAGVGVVT